MSKNKHTQCKPGAAVRLHGYAPAIVLRVWREPGKHGAMMAACRVTAKRKLGPHGFKPGESVTVHAFHAIPRDCIYIQRGTNGRIAWHDFPIIAGGNASA